VRESERWGGDSTTDQRNKVLAARFGRLVGDRGPSQQPAAAAGSNCDVLRGVLHVWLNFGCKPARVRVSMSVLSTMCVRVCVCACGGGGKGGKERTVDNRYTPHRLAHIRQSLR
jgi:hypothetical protein